MDAIVFITEQLRQAREFVEGTMAEVSVGEAHAAVPGRCNPVGATYAHLATGEDWFVNGAIRGQAPLFATSWAGKAGLSEPPPEGGAWDEWAKRVRVDLPAMRSYAQAVGEATDAYIASLKPEDLDRELDLSAIGLGPRTLGWVLGAAVVGHVQAHWGEISALRGIHGERGFPF
ncbi:MAG: DinB family protein [Dehalococcoidia bacterium]